jgi:hypothetical protein
VHIWVFWFVAYSYVRIAILEWVHVYVLEYVQRVSGPGSSLKSFLALFGRRFVAIESRRTRILEYCNTRTRVLQYGEPVCARLRSRSPSLSCSLPLSSPPPATPDMSHSATTSSMNFLAALLPPPQTPAPPPFTSSSSRLHLSSQTLLDGRACTAWPPLTWWRGTRWQNRLRAFTSTFRSALAPSSAA